MKSTKGIEYSYLRLKYNIYIYRNFKLLIFTILILLLFLYIINFYGSCISCFNCNQGDSYEKLFTGLLAGGITLIWALIKYYLEKDRMEKDLYKDFNKRYSGDINDLFERLRTDKSVEIAKSEQETFEDKLLIIDYFNLCGEEFYWYKKGRIPMYVWKNWENGILDTLTIDYVRHILDNEELRYGKYDTYYGFIEYIKIVYNYRKNILKQKK